MSANLNKLMDMWLATKKALTCAEKKEFLIWINQEYQELQSSDKYLKNARGNDAPELSKYEPKGSYYQRLIEEKKQLQEEIKMLDTIKEKPCIDWKYAKEKKQILKEYSLNI